MYKALARENRRRTNSTTATFSMGHFAKRHFAVQSAIWTLLGLTVTANHTPNHTVPADNYTVPTENYTASADNYTVPTENHKKNYTAKLTGTRHKEGALPDGTVALMLICLIMVFISLLAISFHYCNFKKKEKYQKLVKEKMNELVEVDLYDSDN